MRDVIRFGKSVVRDNDFVPIRPQTPLVRVGSPTMGELNRTSSN